MQFRSRAEPAPRTQVAVQTRAAIRARFYIDGKLVDTLPLVAKPKEKTIDGHYSIGSRGGSTPFVGIIDELRFSSYAKSAAEILATMHRDTTQ